MVRLPQLTRLSDGRVLLHIDPRAGGLVLGRSEAEGEFAPDLDLAQYDGQNLGVSRRHAALVQYRNQLHLVDLESANGTFLGEQRLPSNIPVRLKDGDQLRLGSLNLVISAAEE